MKIKTLIMTAAVALITSTAARAADPVVVADKNVSDESWWSSHVYYETETETKHLFRANEFSMDLFAAYKANEGHFDDLFDTNIRHGTWGGGVGFNYFFTRYLGISAETAFYPDSRSFANDVIGSLQLRLPIEVAHLAPYILGGGGYYFNPQDQWAYHAGVGLEFKMNPKLGIFADARYSWMQKTSNEILFRSGLRIAF